VVAALDSPRAADVALVWRSAHSFLARAPRPGLGPFAGARAELGRVRTSASPPSTVQHQPPVRRGGVGPCVAKGFETGFPCRDRRESFQQVAGWIAPGGRAWSLQHVRRRSSRANRRRSERGRFFAPLRHYSRSTLGASGSASWRTCTSTSLRLTTEFRRLARASLRAHGIRQLRGALFDRCQGSGRDRV